MEIDYALATACTRPYIEKLRWTVPTWTIKPQFAGRHLYVFQHGCRHRDLVWIKDYFPNLTIVDWNMPHYDGERELMLSSFVLGAAKHITEQGYIKLDADAFCTNEQDVFQDDDMNHDLCSHRWGYTKPAWWHDKMVKWTNNKPYDDSNKREGPHGCKRIMSWCCWHNMAFVRKIAAAAGDRLPIPSHDSYAWFMADRFEDCTVRRRNLKARGMDHCSKVRSLRNQITARCQKLWSPYLAERLFDNAQLHITYACNLQCANCDRNCGQAPTKDRMTLEQVKRFVDDSLAMGRNWKRIDIIGGEPLMHPQLVEILAIIKGYVDKVGCKVRLTTNGILEDRLKLIPAWVQVRNSSKDPKVENRFETYNVAPKDKGVKHALACSIPWRCGIGVDCYGYYPCGAGAGVARVFGLSCGAKSLADATADQLKAQMKALCQYCGHSESCAKITSKQETSESWVEAFAEYRANKKEQT